MKKSHEKRYVKKAWHKMTTHFKGFAKTCAQEDLHQFRVEIKKLRAFFTLFESCSGKQHVIKHFKPVKKIFKKAGEVRNNFINLRLANEYSLNDEHFTSEQQHEMAMKAAEMQQEGDKLIRRIKRTERRLIEDLKMIRNKVIVNFYKQTLYKISHQLSQHQFSEELHNCRKQIKYLLYNYHLLPKAVKKNVPLNTDYLDRLQNSIGNWHDHVLAVRLFTDYEVNTTNINQRLSLENGQLEQNVLTLADQFWKRVTAA
jgi:CHAD domain-containing protein